MIPATSIAFQPDDTAWLYVPDHGIRTDKTDSRRYMSDFDRPCDTCEGQTIIFRYDGSTDEQGEPTGKYLPCPACNETGRHTFTIDVEPPDPENWTENWRHVLRVSVKPGMVLPISHHSRMIVPVPCIILYDDGVGMWQSGDDEPTLLDPFPSDAKPGGWAVQLVTERAVRTDR